MSGDLVQVALAVAIRGPAVEATLTFTNPTSRSIYVEKAKAVPGARVESDVFEIDLDGETIPFRGPYAKRPPPGPGEFAEIAPHGELRSTVRLDEAYQFPRGSHEYRAAYSAINSIRGEQDLFEMRSNEVRFHYTR
jgi:hypothetical protein